MEITKQYNKCIWCQRPLQPIGTARANGYKHNDWSSRNSHKKCWLENELKNKRKKPEGEYSNVINIEL